MPMYLKVEDMSRRQTRILRVYCRICIKTWRFKGKDLDYLEKTVARERGVAVAE